LAAGGFSGAADPVLDLLIRLGTAGRSIALRRIVRSAEIVGHITLGDDAHARSAERRHEATIRTLWRNRAQIVTDIRRDGFPWFSVTAVLGPIMTIGSVLGTFAGAVFGWYSWIDVLLVVLTLSLGRAMLNSAALLLRGAAPDAPSGAALLRLLLLAPVELCSSVVWGLE
jgi:hypothetical protein